MDFQAIIGLEIHVQLNTKSKMFSSSPCSFGKATNKCVSSLDMGFPGAMPTVNKKAVIFAIRVCRALKMDIDNVLWFDRKNYFYSDLPKGYQITQHQRPIGKNGELTITTENGNKCIRIRCLQLEEDACKQIHFKDKTLVDYNRAGIPLIEIVLEPDIANGEQALKCVEKIRSIVQFLDVSNGKMEEGSLRCDVNVSVRSKDSKIVGTKVEIKNINTLNNIKRAIDFEIQRQSEILNSGGTVLSETRRFDENKKQTVAMRIKTIDADYKYFTEPNIPPIKLSDEFIKKAIDESPELADEKYLRYLGIGLSEQNAHLLTSNKDISNYFDELVKEGCSPTLAANWVNTTVQEVLNKRNIGIELFPISPSDLAELIKFIEKDLISNKQAREIFDKMLTEGKKASSFIEQSKTLLINDGNLLKTHIENVLKDNPSLVNDYKNGKTKVVGYIVGKVMSLTNGKANPSMTNKLVVETLKEK